MKLPDGVSCLVYRDDDGREIVRKLQPEWIPVSERLPEEYKRVLFCEKNGYILVGWHRKIGKRICFIEQVNHYRVNNVIAWMPLPLCYEPQESEE